MCFGLDWNETLWFIENIIWNNLKEFGLIQNEFQFETFARLVIKCSYGNLFCHPF